MKQKEFNSEEYARIGPVYYKVVMWPLISGDTIKILIPWTRQTIIQDYNSKVLTDIKTYDGFCNIPSHISYRKEVDGFLNRYEAIPHKPEEGLFSNVLVLIKHVFQNQFELGLDYLTLLYRNPTQMLPILCLVCKCRLN